MCPVGAVSMMIRLKALKEEEEAYVRRWECYYFIFSIALVVVVVVVQENESRLTAMLLCAGKEVEVKKTPS